MARKPPKIETALEEHEDGSITISRPTGPNVVIWNGICSVDNEIDFMPIRLSGSRDQWNVLNSSMNNDGVFPLETIIDMLHDRSISKAISNIYDSDVNQVSFEIHEKFLLPALTKLQHGNIRLEPELYNSVRWIYVFLQYWVKKPYNTWPIGLQNYNCANERENRADAGSLTEAIVREYYGHDFSFGDWYNNHIVRGKKLDVIKKALSRIDYQPVRYPLSEIFRVN